MSDEIKSQESESLSQETEQEGEKAPILDDRSLSEQNLDALDALPSSRRRSAIILGTAGALFAFCLIILIIMPPLSWKSEKKKQSNYRSLTEISQVESEGGNLLALRYEPMIEKSAYTIDLQQVALYPKDIRTEVHLKADVIFTRPKRRETEDAIMVVLENVEVKVLDGKEEVKLASIGEMLADIGIYSRMGAREGLYTVVPEANINPQVARVLYVFADTIRQVWIPLPEEAVGNKGQWHFKDMVPEMPYFRDSQVAFETKGKSTRLDVTTGLFSQVGGFRLPSWFVKYSDALHIKGILHFSQQGSGKSHIEIAEGRVIGAEVDYRHTPEVGKNAASELVFHAEIHAK